MRTSRRAITALALNALVLALVMPVAVAAPQPDLVIAVSDAPDPVDVRQELTYIITVTNAGDAPATNVVVTDTLDSSVDFVAAGTSQGPGCTHSGTTVTCGLGTLAPGATGTAVIRVLPEATRTITNSATVTSAEPDANPANNSAQATTAVPDGVADVAIVKRDSPDPVERNSVLEYILDVVNNGPDSATGVRVTDRLPDSVDFLSAGSTQGTCDKSGDTVTCNLGILLEDTIATVTIRVIPTEFGTITNKATVRANQDDPRSSNNSSTAETSVPHRVADLVVSLSDDPDPVAIGGRLVYRALIQNRGPDLAGGVRATLDFPDATIFDAMGSSTGRCELVDGEVECGLGTLIAGMVSTVTVSVIPTRPGPLQAFVDVDSGAEDPISSNDRARSVTTVPGVATERITAQSVRSSSPIVKTVATPTGAGYWEVSSSGSVFAFGDAAFFGSLEGLTLHRPIVAMAATPTGNGYWLVASDGGVFAFGDARFHGSTGGRPLNRPIVAMARTPSGSGYWLVASDGGVFSFGDARFHGSTGSILLAQPVVDVSPTPSGKGYWLVASDGGIFGFGDAVFVGSTGRLRLTRPVVGMAATPSGSGYWLVASDGGVFAFGDARFHGSTGAIALARPITGMAATRSGNGYWLVASDGGVFSFGDSAFLGRAFG